MEKIIEMFTKIVNAFVGKFTKIERNEAVQVLKQKEQKQTMPLLHLIGEKESRGNYDAYFGKAGNNEIKFTNMTVRDVRKWQDDFVSKGSKSSAVGKYQIIRKTMDSLIDELKLTGDEKFTPELQDKMALTLANRRGYNKFKEGKLSKEQFANNLAKEWASFPVVTPINGKRPGQSFYAGDGLNKALIGVDQVMSALDNELKSGQA